MLGIDSNRGLSELQRQETERTIFGRLLKELRVHHTPEEILIFGCGYNSFPILVTRYFEDSAVTAYDINEEKIKSLLANPMKTHERLTYTTKNPDRVFDVVLAMAVLHEDPRQLALSVASFTLQKGYVGVIDYDMVGIEIQDFLKCWGCSPGEKRELGALGIEKTHDLHTNFGLDECVAFMEEAGVLHVFAEAGLVSYSGTKHFIYLGQKS